MVTTVCSGYTCGSCGAWVPYGQTHYCGQGLSNYPPFVIPNCEQCKKVTELIEKILKLLEEKSK
jgi:hypothetical protein